MEEDDPVIGEIPVYLSKNLANLNVIQFPVSNNRYNLDQSNIVNCCYKPKSQHLKIDYKIETDSRNYDAFKGDNLARIADGLPKSTSKAGPSTSKQENKKERPTFASGRMDKITFLSSVASNDPRYAVGMLINGELHLVPIKTFFQMRQPYAYFDKGDNRTKSEKNESTIDEVEEEVKAVTVKFAKTADTERIKKAKERSFYHFSQIGKDEEWCEAMVYGCKNSMSELQRQKFHNTTDGIVNHFVNIPPHEYFAKLVNTEAYQLIDFTQTSDGTKTEETEEKTAQKSSSTTRDILSKRQIKKLPLLEQLKVILKDAKILSFSSLMDMVNAPGVTADKVLRNLALCGTMIRGNWTLQSEILYPSIFKSSINGITSELMCRGRDYVLYKLMQSDFEALNRQRIGAVTQLPSEETKEILESVAHLTFKYDDFSSKRVYWELLKPPDNEFEKRHPDICQRQDALWKAQEEKFTEMEHEKSEKRKRTRSVREIKVEK